MWRKSYAIMISLVVECKVRRDVNYSLIEKKKNDFLECRQPGRAGKNSAIQIINEGLLLHSNWDRDWTFHSSDLFGKKVGKY